MSEKQIDNSRQLERERALYQYANALERGDFATIQTILDEATRDADLEQMIFELHDAYQDEPESVYADDAALVRELLRAHLPSGLAMSEGEVLEAPPLTVGDVCASLQTKAAIQGGDAREVKTFTEQLRLSEAPLPDELTGRNLRRLFAQLGVSVSERFQELFREAAIFLSISREQDMARLSAARREPRRRPHSKPSEKQKGSEKKMNAITSLEVHPSKLQLSICTKNRRLLRPTAKRCIAPLRRLITGCPLNCVEIAGLTRRSPSLISRTRTWPAIGLTTETETSSPGFFIPARARVLSSLTAQTRLCDDASALRTS